MVPGWRKVRTSSRLPGWVDLTRRRGGEKIIDLVKNNHYLSTSASSSNGRAAMDEMDARVAAMRRFNRFYTRRVGVLGEGHLQSQYSLTEVRVLYEVAHQERITASELGERLALDAGYLSRILGRFQERGLV